MVTGGSEGCARRRGTLLGLAALVGPLLWGCSGDEMTPPVPSLPVGTSVESTPERGADWHEVSMTGRYHDLSPNGAPGIMAGGRYRGDPVMVTVHKGRLFFSDAALPGGASGLDQVESDGDNVVVTPLTDASTGGNSRVTGTLVDYGGYLWHVAVTDEEGVSPVWVTPLFDGEGDFRVVGGVPHGQRWSIRAWTEGRRMVQMDAGPELYVDREPDSESVIVGNDEGSLVVAGRFATRPAGPVRTGVWRLVDRLYLPGPKHWRLLRTATEPDAFTDLDDWEIGWWLAGHRDGRPVVYDFDDDRGSAVEMPVTALDPARPTVLVAGIPFTMVLATQSTDGPTIWVDHGNTWTRLPAPSGRLQDLEVDGDEVYVLIDGVVWWKHVEGLLPTLTPMPRPGARNIRP